MRCIAATGPACLLLLAASSAIAQRPPENIDVVRQPLVAGQPVDPAVLDALGLVTVTRAATATTPGGTCSGAMLNRYWVLTADHCISGVTPPGVTVDPAWTGPATQMATQIVSFQGDGYDVALIRVRLAIERSSIEPLPRITGRPNERYLQRVVETYGRGIFRLASNAGGTDMPSASDGTYRLGVFTVDEVGGPLSIRLHMPDGATIAGGDSGGPSYQKFWVDPNRHERGTFREIVGVASRCRTDRLRGKEDTPDWTWISRVGPCWIATPAAIRDRVEATIADETPAPEEIPPPLFGANVQAGGAGSRRALYVTSWNRPLVPPMPPAVGQPLRFTVCDPSFKLTQVQQQADGCPLRADYEVWFWTAQRPLLVHAPSNLCLRPAGGNAAEGTPLVLDVCNPADATQRWEVQSSPPGSAIWSAIRNAATGQCATAEIPPGSSGPIQTELQSRLALVSRPCNATPAQRFDAVDAGWQARHNPVK